MRKNYLFMWSPARGYSNLRATVRRVMYGQFPTNFFFLDFSIFLLFCGKKNLIFFKNILKREKKKIDEKKFEIENLQNN